MKKIIVYSFVLMVLTNFLNINTIELKSQIFSSEIGKEHDLLHNFTGEWYQIGNYTNSEGKSTSAKGTIKGEVILGGAICKLQSLQANTISLNESMILIGYDKSLQKYFFHGYDREGNLPSTYLGDFDKTNKKINFETYMIDMKGNKIRSTLELWFEREDKFMYKITVFEVDKKTVIAEVANIKVTDKTNDNLKEKIKEKSKKQK